MTETLPPKEVFEVNGKKFLAFPSIKELLQEAGLDQRTRDQVFKILKREEINHLEQLLTFSKYQLHAVGLPTNYVELLYQHIQLVKRRNSILLTASDLKEIEENYAYLRTPSAEVNQMLSYSNGKQGIRSRTMTELYGASGSGKTQWCMTAAAIAMRPIDQGGWNKSVYYIDSNHGFEYSRFKTVCSYWGVDEQRIKTMLFVTKVDSFDEVETALLEISARIRELNIGLIVIDSIIQPLRLQYPVNSDNFELLQPRQKHLKRVIDQIKSIITLNNILCLYTNQTRRGFKNEAEIVPQGGFVLGHASDIRISLEEIKLGVEGQDTKEKKLVETLAKKNYGLRKATVVDCGFLPITSGRYVVGAPGITDLSIVDKLAN